MEKQYRDFELPKFYRYSSLCVIIGLIMLYRSHSMYFVSGNGACLGCLAIGFSLLAVTVFLRASVIFEVLWQQSHDRARLRLQ